MATGCSRLASLNELNITGLFPLTQLHDTAYREFSVPKCSFIEITDVSQHGNTLGIEIML